MNPLLHVVLSLALAAIIFSNAILLSLRLLTKPGCLWKVTATVVIVCGIHAAFLFMCAKGLYDAIKP